MPRKSGHVGIRRAVGDTIARADVLAGVRSNVSRTAGCLRLAVTGAVQRRAGAQWVQSWRSAGQGVAFAKELE